MDSNRAKDSRKYLNRTDLAVSNANLFISNNNNPFLISPYAPPANLVKTQQLVPINDLISTTIGNLSSVIDLTTWTLRICTITNSPYYPDVNISSQNILLKGSNEITIDAPDINFIGLANFETISTGFIFANLADISTLNVSSINVNDETINFLTINSTLNASSIFSNNLSTGNLFASFANMSTLNVYDLTSFNQSTNYLSTGNLFAHNLQSFNQSTNYLSTGNLFGGNIIFQTLAGSIATFSTLTVSSLLSVSSISTTNIMFETLSGNSATINSLVVHSTLVVSSINAASSIRTKEFIFSSLCMIPSTFSSLVTATSSILICMNGEFWGIPVGKF